MDDLTVVDLGGLSPSSATHRIRVVIEVDGIIERTVERTCNGYAHGLSTGMLNGRPRDDGNEDGGKLTVNWWKEPQ